MSEGYDRIKPIAAYPYPMITGFVKALSESPEWITVYTANEDADATRFMRIARSYRKALLATNDGRAQLKDRTLDFRRSPAHHRIIQFRVRVTHQDVLAEVLSDAING